MFDGYYETECTSITTNPNELGNNSESTSNKTDEVVFHFEAKTVNKIAINGKKIIFYGCRIPLEHNIQNNKTTNKVIHRTKILFRLVKAIEKKTYIWLSKEDLRKTKHFIGIDWNHWKEENNDNQDDD